MKVMLFSGTSEGRILAEFCKENHIEVQVHVATEYGQKVMGEVPVVVGRMDCEEMVRELRAYQPDYVVDATHPYAVEVTENIRGACEREGFFYIRLFRQPEDIAMQDKKGIIKVSSIKEAAEYLSATKGNILVATGSKELAAYTVLADYRNRIYLRALPTEAVKKQCRELGIAKEHLILEQGPFSIEQNRLHIRKCKAAYIVTKESGKAGGFSDKIEAAKSENITVIVVCRPAKENGYSLSEVIQMLRKKL